MLPHGVVGETDRAVIRGRRVSQESGCTTSIKEELELTTYVRLDARSSEDCCLDQPGSGRPRKLAARLAIMNRSSTRRRIGRSEPGGWSDRLTLKSKGLSKRLVNSWSLSENKDVDHNASPNRHENGLPDRARRRRPCVILRKPYS